MPINLQRLQVLVVDDNTHMRNLVRAILNALDIGGLRECVDGSDALEVLRTFPADLVIVDWMMEPLDGIDFVRLLRRAPDSPARYVGVIMMSGHSQADNVAQARDAGANEFVVKPISARTLYQRIVEIVDNPRQFVKSASYFGPDRRRRDKKPRRERRTIAPALVNAIEVDVDGEEYEMGE